jgi:Rad3-related DNA helicase
MQMELSDIREIINNSIDTLSKEIQKQEERTIERFNQLESVINSKLETHYNSVYKDIDHLKNNDRDLYNLDREHRDEVGKVVQRLGRDAEDTLTRFGERVGVTEQSLSAVKGELNSLQTLELTKLETLKNEVDELKRMKENSKNNFQSWARTFAPSLLNLLIGGGVVTAMIALMQKVMVNLDSLGL